jgi:hypothetical protein
MSFSDDRIEEFCADESFVEFALELSQDSVLFWEQRIAQDAELAQIAELAKALVLKLEQTSTKLPSNQIKMLWDDLEAELD